MRRRKRHGPVFSKYNSKKYHAMHKANISRGLKEYWYRRKAHEAVQKGTATPEQKEFVHKEERLQFIVFAVFTVVGMILMLIGMLWFK